jgi:hypothetical protein
MEDDITNYINITAYFNQISLLKIYFRAASSVLDTKLSSENIKERAQFR